MSEVLPTIAPRLNTISSAPAIPPPATIVQNIPDESTRAPCASCADDGIRIGSIRARQKSRETLRRLRGYTTLPRAIDLWRRDDLCASLGETMPTTQVEAFAPGEEQVRRLIRDVPDFPQNGIVFKDITPLLADPAGLAMAVELMAQPYRGKGVEVVVGAESRGFIFGTAIAKALAAGFVPARKPGKLPSRTRRHNYELEYGSDALEMHADALRAGQRVLIVDDLLATGGTLCACAELVKSFDAKIIGIVVLIELVELKGRDRMKEHAITSVIRY